MWSVYGWSAELVSELFAKVKLSSLRVTGERYTPKRCYVYAHLGCGRTSFYNRQGYPQRRLEGWPASTFAPDLKRLP